MFLLHLCLSVELIGLNVSEITVCMSAYLLCMRQHPDQKDEGTETEEGSSDGDSG